VEIESNWNVFSINMAFAEFNDVFGMEIYEIYR
jgi:hypothetical protein